MGKALSDKEWELLDAYWRAANYLSIGQIYLYDNPLLKQPLTKEHIKPRLLGHWGTTPGLNFIYVHLNRMIKKHDLDMIYITGPGHGGPGLSRDSLVTQRIARALGIQGVDRGVDGGIEDLSIGEGMVCEVVSFQFAPDDLDVVEFGRVFGQPLDGEPVRAGGERGARGLADVDRSVVEHDHDRLAGGARLWSVEPVQFFQQRYEVGAALGSAGVDDELASAKIERADHGDLGGLSGRRHAQVGAALGPGARQIGMGQRLALVGEQQHDVAGLRLGFQELEPQSAAVYGIGVLLALEGVAWPAKAEPPFCRSTTESRDFEMRTPSRCSISLIRRGRVQFLRSATGADSTSSATRSAACVLTGSGPPAIRRLRPATPLLRKSLRHSRTVSSRTPNAWAIRALLQPARVNRIARARSASARSLEAASACSPVRCSSVAVTGDFPAMTRLPNQFEEANHSAHPLARAMNPA